MVDTKKHIDENEHQYIYRIGTLIDSGEIESWKTVAPILNAELRADESEYRDESAYRKPYQYAKMYYEDVFSKMGDGEYSKQLAAQKDELYKLKKQISDQRREYNSKLTLDARADHLFEHLSAAADRMNASSPLVSDPLPELVFEDTEAVIFFSDWHYGMCCDNVWNTYNTAICRRRLCEVVQRAKGYLRQNKVKTLHVVVLGDLIHGAIHTSCRVASEENTCDQIMDAAELLAQAISDLASEVSEVKVYCTYGNHGRTVQNVKDNLHADNMETLIPWWLEQRFSQSDRVKFPDAQIDEFLIVPVCGSNIACTHGDLDNIKDIALTMNTLFTKKYGISIDYTVSADKHHLEGFEQYGIESLIVPSLCGSDEFANNHRLYSNPGQSMYLFNDEFGRFAIYNIMVR
jgi:hypothetical protein